MASVELSALIPMFIPHLVWIGESDVTKVVHYIPTTEMILLKIPPHHFDDSSFYQDSFNSIQSPRRYNTKMSSESIMVMARSLQ